MFFSYTRVNETIDGLSAMAESTIPKGYRSIASRAANELKHMLFDLAIQWPGEEGGGYVSFVNHPHTAAYLTRTGPYAMPNKQMTLIERLLNPQWVKDTPERAILDIDMTLKTMKEAVEEIERLSSLVQAKSQT